MNQPLISIVIPAYNAAQTLTVTVKSVLKQTVQDFEILVVDDGSKDNTLQIAQSIATQDSRIKVISQPNGGASAARNTGIKAAKGEYVALLDADDLWMPHKLERQLEVLEGEKGVSAVQSGVYYVKNNLEITSVRQCFQSKNVLLETLLFQNLPALMSTLLIKRSVFEKIGYFDTSLEILEDWDLAIRLSKYCNFTSVAEPLTLYRQFEGNRSKDLSIHIKPGYLILERLFNDPTLPELIQKKRNLIYSTFYRMLCGGAFNVGRYAESMKWGVKSLVKHPPSLIYMLSLPLRKLKRKSSQEMISKEDRSIIGQLKQMNNSFMSYDVDL